MRAHFDERNGVITWLSALELRLRGRLHPTGRRRTGALVRLLLVSAGMGTLPGEEKGVAFLRNFYQDNRTVIVIAQAIGLAAALGFLASRVGCSVDTGLVWFRGCWLAGPPYRRRRSRRRAAVAALRARRICWVRHGLVAGRRLGLDRRGAVRRHRGLCGLGGPSGRKHRFAVPVLGRALACAVRALVLMLGNGTLELASLTSVVNPARVSGGFTSCTDGPYRAGSVFGEAQLALRTCDRALKANAGTRPTRSPFRPSRRCRWASSGHSTAGTHQR